MENHWNHIVLKSWNTAHIQKFGWIQAFSWCFKGTGCLHWGARYEEFVARGHLCHYTARYAIPLHTDNYVDFNSEMSVNNALAICGISNKDKLCDDHMGCGRT